MGGGSKDEKCLTCQWIIKQGRSACVIFLMPNWLADLATTAGVRRHIRDFFIPDTPPQVLELLVIAVGLLVEGGAGHLAGSVLLQGGSEVDELEEGET